MLHKLRQLFQLRRAIQLVWHSAPGWTIASLCFAVIQGVLPLAVLYLTKLLIDTLSSGATGTSAAQVWQQTLELVIITGVITLINGLCGEIASYARLAQAQIVTDHIQGLIHAKSIEVDLEYYENSHYYDALHMAQQDAPHRPPLIVDLLITFTQDCISLTAIAILLFSLHWAIAIVLVVTAIPLLFVQLKYANRYHQKQEEWSPLERRSDYYSHVLTTLDFAKEVRLFSLGELFRRRFQQLRSTVRRDRLDLARKSALAEWSMQVCATLAIFGVCGFIAWQAVQGIITVGSLVMYYQAFQKGQTTLQSILSSIAALYQNSLFVGRLFKFLELQRSVPEPTQPIAFPVPLQGGIRFEQVQFRYPHSTRSLLEDVNLTLRAGETIALVGENGAGKTTLIKLLCRLYDPTQGRITVDGVDIRQFATPNLRQQISVVFQDYAHYNMTVGENIGIGDLQYLDDQAKIMTAATKAGVDRAIQRLPQSYETLLGQEFEEGEELSIGEWQKIALARSFIRQSQIVVLDEPTSALDARAEYRVFEQFRQLSQGKTAVLISHRLSTVKLADRIYFLKAGRIIESGTHAELIQRQGDYAQLFELQASSYAIDS